MSSWALNGHWPTGLVSGTVEIPLPRVPPSSPRPGWQGALRTSHGLFTHQIPPTGSLEPGICLEHLPG